MSLAIFNKITEARMQCEKIADLKRQLSATDYKVIKAYEYSLVGLEAPYDIVALHNERQALRDAINKLEVSASA